MNIKLPKKVDERITKELGAFIDKKTKTLYVQRERFEETMIALTYQMKGKDVCNYCGNELTNKIRTIDHIYPKDCGGATITDNLLPCCKECNVRKRNFNKEEFENFSKLEKKSNVIGTYLKDFYKKLDMERETTGVVIPSKWYVLKKDYEVWAQITSVERYRTDKKYIQIERLFKRYGKLCRTVTVTKNGIVVEGFLTLMFAKNLPYKVPIPFIILENVIAI